MGRWHGIILFLRMCVDTNRQSLDISIMGFRSIDLLLVMLQRFIVLISAWIRVTIAAHLCIINWWDWLRPWWFAPSVGFPFIKQLRLRTLESRLPTPSVRSSEFMHKPLAALTSKWVYAFNIEYLWLAYFRPLYVHTLWLFRYTQHIQLNQPDDRVIFFTWWMHA